MAAPRFVIDFEPMYGEMVEVSPLLRRLVCKNPSKFTFHGTGTYVIGRGDVAVVDPGPRDDDHIAALLAALDGARDRARSPPESRPRDRPHPGTARRRPRAGRPPCHVRRAGPRR